MAINFGANPSRITDKIGGKLQDALQDILVEKKDSLRSEGFEKVTQFYDETEQNISKTQEKKTTDVSDSEDIIDLAYAVKKLGKDGFISKFGTVLVKKMIEKVKIPFVEMTLDEIRIETKGKQQQAKIKNFKAEVGPLWPVAKVVFTAFNVPQTFEIKFQIDATVKIPEMEFYTTQEELEIRSGKLFADLNLSLLEVDVDYKKIKAARSLGEKKFDVDLAGHKFSMAHSKKCPSCNTPNHADANFCCECGKNLKT